MAIPNPSAYYKFDTNSNDSVGSNNGVDNAMSYGVAGKIGNAADFNGTTSRITLSPFSAFTSDWTVAFWILRDRTGVLECPLQLGRNTNFPWFYFNAATNNFRFVEDNIAEYASSITISTTGVWNHIGVTKIGTGANNLTYYLNGAAAGTASVGTVVTPAAAAYMGAYSTDGSNFLFHFDGRIDEPYFAPVGLTAGEMSELFNGGDGATYPFLQAMGFFHFF